MEIQIYLGFRISLFRIFDNLDLPINHGPSTSFYYRDPDGHGVELFVDNFETERELKGWMESEAFAANPIGTSFDPKKLIERYEAGDPIEEIVKQGSA